MSRKYRNRKSRKSRKSKPQHNRQPRERQPREFSHKHRNNRVIPRHEPIKKPPVPSFPTPAQDAESRWDYHILRLQKLCIVNEGVKS